MVSKERIGIEPALGNCFDRLPYCIWRQKPFQERIRLLKSTGHRKEHVLLDGREGAVAAREVIPGTVMEVERRTVVDEHQSPVPEEHVGITRCAIYVGDVCIEPYDRGGKQRIEPARVKRVEGECSGSV